MNPLWIEKTENYIKNSMFLWYRDGKVPTKKYLYVPGSEPLPYFSAFDDSAIQFCDFLLQPFPLLVGSGCMESVNTAEKAFPELIFNQGIEPSQGVLFAFISCD